MRLDNRTVDHHVFIVVIRRQMTKYPLDNTTFAPATHAPVDILPVAEAQKKITPR